MRDLLGKCCERAAAKDQFEVLGCLIVAFKLHFPEKLSQVATHLESTIKKGSPILWQLESALPTLSNLRENIRFVEESIFLLDSHNSETSTNKLS